jgi:outer membrane immunogenic protein
VSAAPPWNMPGVVTGGAIERSNGTMDEVGLHGAKIDPCRTDTLRSGAKALACFTNLTLWSLLPQNNGVWLFVRARGPAMERYSRLWHKRILVKARGVRMKKLLLATVSAAALTGAAQAADMSAPRLVAKAAPAPTLVPTWAGLYLGVQGGLAWHEGTLKDLDTFFLPAGTSRSSRTTGGIAGGNIGYNWQFNSFVFGVEGDANWVGAKAGETFVSAGLITSYDVRWLATLRARAGIAFDTLLLYVTGGVAFAGVNDTATELNSGTPIWVLDQTRAGPTFGGGIEYMFSRNWTVRAEGRVADFGRATVACPQSVCKAVAVPAYRGEFSNRVVTGMVALDYKF